MSQSTFDHSVNVLPATENRSKLMKLADGIKTKSRKKSSNFSSHSKKSSGSLSGSKSGKYDPAFTNIEHLVYGTYKPRPSTPNYTSLNIIIDNEGSTCNGKGKIDNFQPLKVIAKDKNSSIDELSSQAKCECKAHSPNGTPQHKDNLTNESNGLPQATEKHNWADESSQVMQKHDHSFSSDECDENETVFNHSNDCDKTLNSNDEQLNQMKMGKNSKKNSSKIPQPVMRSNLLNSRNSSSNSCDHSEDVLNGVNEKQRNAHKLDQLGDPEMKFNGIQDVNCFNAGFTPMKIHHQRLRRDLLNSAFFQDSDFNDVLSNMNLQRRSIPRGSLIASPFPRIRSTIHPKRMSNLHFNSLRRHNSFDTYRHYGLPMIRNSKLSRSMLHPDKNDDPIYISRRSSNSSYSTIDPSSSTNNSTVAPSNHFYSSSQNAKHSISNQNYSPESSSSSCHTSNSSPDKSRRSSTSSIKSQSSLKRNRPLVKGGPNERSTVKSVKNKSRFNNEARSVHDRFREMHEQFLASKLSSMNLISNMMDEDDFFMTPKRIWKTPIAKTNSFDQHLINHQLISESFRRRFEEFAQRTSPFSIFNYDPHEKSPRSLFNSPEKHEKPPTQFNRNNSCPLTSTSDYQLSSLLLREAQKDALTQVNSQQPIFSKSSRPWSHIYSDSEAKKIYSKSRFNSIDNNEKLKSSHKRNSDPNVLNSETLTIAKQQSNNPTILQSAIPGSSNETVLQKFKKTLSLRFSRSGQNHRIESPVQAKLRSSLRSKSEDTKERRTTWYGAESDKINNCKERIRESKTEEDISHLEQTLSNQDEEQKKLQRSAYIDRQLSAPHPIKSRDLNIPKPMRKNSNKARLRRSFSQPYDIEKANWSSLSSPQSKESVNQGSEPEIDSESTSKNPPLSRKSSGFQESEDDLIYVEALWDHVTLDPEELSFRAGEVIEVTDSSDKDWWWGTIDGNEERSGWFPAAFVRMKVNQDQTIEECLNNSSDGFLTKTPKKRMSVSLLSNEQVRANVVLEIINTERDFVKHLNDIVEGYLKKCKHHTEMFTAESIKTIFGNIEQLYEFQRRFLNQLETCINWENLSQSTIGDCFLKNEAGFTVYCEYCNNHSLAVSELQDLYAKPKYAHFFEGCRLMQNMIDISLDGFLLTPIQKICKYPLQLAELLKYTRVDHKDNEPVKSALEAMQRVAQLVNERKRRIESLEQIVSFQESVEGWEGQPLIDLASILIHSGDVIRYTESGWSKEVTLFLYDHVLVCCKKDNGILKKNSYSFKGILDMDSVTQIVDVEDGVKDQHFNVVPKNSFKLYNSVKEKWYMFQAKTKKEKDAWLRGFVDERKRIEEDEKQGFYVSENDKRCAHMAHVNHLKPKRPRAKIAKGQKPRRPDAVVAEVPLEPNGFELDRHRAGSLPSYTHHFINMNKSTRLKKKGSGWFNLGSKGKGKRQLKRSLKNS